MYVRTCMWCLNGILLHQLGETGPALFTLVHTMRPLKHMKTTLGVCGGKGLEGRIIAKNLPLCYTQIFNFNTSLHQLASHELIPMPIGMCANNNAMQACMCVCVHSS